MNTIVRRLWLAGALLLAPVSALAQGSTCPQFFVGGQAPRFIDTRLAQRTTLLCNDAFAVTASGVTHGALWSAEHPTTASLVTARDTKRQGQFYADERLPLADQAQLADYRRSGYDRGHMTPSGDMPDEQAQQQSFSLTNMVPQTPKLNRGVWAKIETVVRDRAASSGELYVVTGPAFKGTQIGAIGPDGVLVPTSTWKAVYDPAAGGAGAYLCTNTAAPTCDVVSVAALTRLLGIDPFPSVSVRVKETTMDLPQPSARSYAGKRRSRRKTPGILEQLLGQ